MDNKSENSKPIETSNEANVEKIDVKIAAENVGKLPTMRAVSNGLQNHGYQILGLLLAAAGLFLAWPSSDPIVVPPEANKLKLSWVATSGIKDGRRTISLDAKNVGILPLVIKRAVSCDKPDDTGTEARIASVRTLQPGQNRQISFTGSRTAEQSRRFEMTCTLGYSDDQGDYLTSIKLDVRQIFYNEGS